MFKKILLPTDGSELSEKAVRQCMEFAKSTGARVVGFHAEHRYSLLAYGAYAETGDVDTAPPTKEELAAKQKEKDAANGILEESPMRDTYVPIAITFVGVVLAFQEAMTVGKHPAKTIGEAIPLVATRITLGVGLVLLGMFLAAALAEVCFIGSFKKQILRFISIAVGPAALWGLFNHWMGGDWAGAASAFGTIAIYFVLFYFMLRLDLQDSAICTIIVFIVIAFANYAAYRAEEMMKGSWI